mgnify:FL=1
MEKRYVMQFVVGAAASVVAYLIIEKLKERKQ